MVNPCRKWESKLEHAVKEGNRFNELKFKEKLVECIVYTARLMHRDKETYSEIVNYGLEVAKKYNIPDIEYQLKVLEYDLAPRAKSVKQQESH